MSLTSQKRAPGPPAVSCLTCRNKHKKCDRRRPFCETCEKGSFHCLGYSYNQRKVVTLERSKPRPILPKPQKQQLTITPTTQVSARLDAGINEGSAEESLVAGRSFVAKDPPNPYSSEFFPISQETSGSEIPTSHENAGALTPTSQLPTLFGSSPTTARSCLSLHQLFSFFTQIPSSPPDTHLTYLNSPHLDSYIMDNVVRMVKYLYFKPTESHRFQLFTAFITRLTTSRLSRWVKLLTTKVVEGLAREDASKNQFYKHWLEEIEARIRSILAHNPTSREARELCGDWLEIKVLKTVLVPGSSAYQVLRGTAPTFLQAAYSCPELWSTHSDPTIVPLRNILTSSRIELASFALVDSTFAMAFGLPQQIDYDTSGSPLPKRFLPHEWAQNSPAEFQLLLTDINTCRDNKPGALDWREIERMLVTWQPPVARQDSNWESWMEVAWLAVQESWRLTLLAYLYMAVCGSSSDDPRIQRCVTQTLQVVGTVMAHESTGINVPFFIQYLMAGICARTQKHRAIVRDKLLDKYETRFWKMRGADFVPVLDHLWNEASSSGRPVTWHDYVRSRELMLPVAV